MFHQGNIFKTCVVIYFWMINLLQAQDLTVSDPYLRIRATAGDPLYTTYAAAMSRSRLYGDKAYKMTYDSGCDPVYYSTDQGGRFFSIWMIDKVVMDRTQKFYEKPVVTASFPDMNIMEYQPFPGIEVRECFFVYSSDLALVDLRIDNRSGVSHLVEIFPVLEIRGDSTRITGRDDQTGGYIMNHYETKERLISNLYAKEPYPVFVRDVFSCYPKPNSFGGYRGDMEGFYQIIKTDFYKEKGNQDSLNLRTEGWVDYAALHYKFLLQPGTQVHIRVFRGEQDRSEDPEDLTGKIGFLQEAPLQPFLDDNIGLFSRMPRPAFADDGEKLIYLGALNLARGCMLPPSGKTTRNFYVFSRNPLWGWGHGHQVLHESLSMLAYALLDPQSAQESQRVYMDQQGPDGLIAYRHGPRGLQDYPHNGQSTTSAPFFSWINLEVFKTSHDTAFLREAYSSGCRYMEWLEKNRDKDHDGTFEWGPYGLIENVRDWYNVIFQVSAERHLDIDKEDISDELECLDLSVMIVKELRSLSEMASLLGKNPESAMYQNKAVELSERINRLMWDEESGFYYHVDMKDHGFRFMTRDLRRQEIIGFLPMWAGVASEKQAERLVTTLCDTAKFWRKYGIPTLSASDEYYSPYVDYCCKWNGPVWLLWNYLVFDGLISYGYHREAAELADKMILAVKEQLSRNHNFPESFSPDYLVLDCPTNYIWDCIMARVILEKGRLVKRNH